MKIIEFNEHGWPIDFNADDVDKRIGELESTLETLVLNQLEES